MPLPFPARRVKDNIASGGRFAPDTIHPRGFAFMLFARRFLPLAALLLPLLSAQAQQPASDRITSPPAAVSRRIQFIQEDLPSCCSLDASCRSPLFYCLYCPRKHSNRPQIG